ncbi:MAG: TetR/AcrR family transcriptional regulator [Oscillospiraceae bacterium]|nr:TetR/AcrR family transcriptional regulator [Oscillospiraceae bacterium]
MTYAEKRTRAHFQNAFIKMIKEVGYSKITVRKLVAYADYNRTSFYRYYNNLDELSDEIIDFIVKTFYNSFEKEYKDYEKTTSQIYATIYENRDYFDLLALNDSIPQLKEQFLMCIEKILNELIIETDEHEIWNNEYIYSFYAHATFGIIETWIKNNYALDYKTLAKYIYMSYDRPFYYKVK